MTEVQEKSSWKDYIPTPNVSIGAIFLGLGVSSLYDAHTLQTGGTDKFGKPFTGFRDTTSQSFGPDGSIVTTHKQVPVTLEDQVDSLTASGLAEVVFGVVAILAPYIIGRTISRFSK